MNTIEITIGNNEKILVKSLKFIFQSARFAHFLGILAMIGFALLAVLGQEFQAEIIWGESWQIFDYIYFIALLSLLVVFLVILLNLRKVRKPILASDTSLIINSLIQ